MTAENADRPLKIAILGAGIVGTYAAAILSRLDNVEINVYEKSDAVREVEAAITLTEASIITLSRLSGLDALKPLLHRSKDHRGLTVRHWKTGEYFPSTSPPTLLPHEFTPAKSQRTTLLEFITSHVPQGIIHYGYDAESVEIKANEIDVSFKNGETISADLVVSANGIYSRIRRQFTNDKIRYKGAVAYRNVFDEGVVKHIPNLPDDFTVWVGRGSAMFMTKLAPGKFNVAAHIREPPDVVENLKWNQSTGDWGKNRMIEHFKDWDPLIGEILEVMPEPQAFPLERAPWLKKLTIGNRLVFVGDAAHPTSGLYGAGASLGFDDVWVLYRSLSETSGLGNDNQGLRYDVPKAFVLFDETRSPFLQRLEQQIDIDSDFASKAVATAKTDAEWQERVKRSSLGSQWVTQHNAEAEFQKVRDQYLLDLVRLD